MTPTPSFSHLAFRAQAWMGWLLWLMTLATLPAQAGSRFQPNAAGDEITDGQTGLVWRRCAEGQDWHGGTCTGSSLNFTWDEALARAQIQAGSSGQAWRLPNAKELTSLVDYRLADLVIDTQAFPGAPSEFFWSATPVLGDVPHAWGVHFDNGFVDMGSRSDGHAVRLVRPAP
jgi:hypothetical protein